MAQSLKKQLEAAASEVKKWPEWQRNELWAWAVESSPQPRDKDTPVAKRSEKK
jgi:hypothetical protein